jgi:hypothetical protein
MKMDNFYFKAMRGGDVAELQKEGQELEALDKELGGVTPGEPFDLQGLLEQARFEGALRAYYAALVANKDAAELSKLEAAARALAPKDEDFESDKKQVLEQANKARQMTGSASNSLPK